MKIKVMKGKEPGRYDVPIKDLITALDEMAGHGLSKGWDEFRKQLKASADYHNTINNTISMNKEDLDDIEKEWRQYRKRIKK